LIAVFYFVSRHFHSCLRHGFAAHDRAQGAAHNHSELLFVKRPPDTPFAFECDAQIMAAGRVIVNEIGIRM